MTDRVIRIPIDFDRIPLPENQVAATTADYIDGRLFDWQKTGFDLQLDKASSRTSKWHSSMVEQTPQAKEAYVALQQDLSTFNLDLDLLRSERFNEFFDKMYVGIALSATAKLQKSKGGLSPQLESYTQDAMERYTQFYQMVAELKPQNIQIYYKVRSAMEKYSVFKSTESPLIRSFLESISSETQIISKHQQDLFSRLNGAIGLAENQILTNWTWKQTLDALNLLPQITTKQTRTEIVRNCIETLTDEQAAKMYIGDPKDLEMPEEVWQQLLTFNLADFEPFEFKRNPAEWAQFLGEELYPNWPSRKEFPGMTALAFLSRLKHANGQIFVSELEKMVQMSQKSSELRVPLAANVIALAGFGELEAEIANGLIANMQLEPKVKQVLLDKVPGFVVVTKTGQLLARDTNQRMPTGSYTLYTSTLKVEDQTTEAELTTHTSETPKETKVPENQIEEEAIFAYDFLGDIGIMKDEDTAKYLDSTKPKVLEDPDELELEFYDLSEKYDYNQNNTRIFISDLNSTDATIRRARQLDIDAIVISGPAVTFVLSKDKLYSMSDDKKVPVAFSGVLNEEGVLYLDTEVEGTQAHVLLLNNIALELASRTVEEPHPESKEQAEKTIADWNRTKRGTLPRLNRTLATSGDVLIAVKANGHTVFTSQS